MDVVACLRSMDARVSWKHVLNVIRIKLLNSSVRPYLNFLITVGMVHFYFSLVLFTTIIQLIHVSAEFTKLEYISNDCRFLREIMNYGVVLTPPGLLEHWMEFIVLFI